MLLKVAFLGSKKIYKYWWSEELSILKQNAIDTNKVWKAAGKPHYGPIFYKQQSCRLIYRKRLRQEQNSETYSYTNALHDALLRKKRYGILEVLAFKIRVNEQMY